MTENSREAADAGRVQSEVCPSITPARRDLQFDADGNIVGLAFTTEVDYFVEFDVPSTQPHQPTREPK